MLRTETRTRARALQLLYAWELQDRPPMSEVMPSVAGITRSEATVRLSAERLANSVVDQIENLDSAIADTADNWRFERIGVVERNICRLALCELKKGDAPAAVIIDEALRLAHWFAGPRAPAFINGVLDTLARHHGRL